MTDVGAFTVVAIIAARNEADVLDQVIDDLIRQHVDVYLIDDGSTDDSAQVGEARLGRGVIGVERRPPSKVFEWTSLLRRKEELSATLDGHWFLHHDADEFRESPWAHLDLRAAIHQVDALGYNAIDFRVLNFRPTTAEPASGDIRVAMPYWEEAGQVDRLQVKCWKKTDAAVDLATSGGHDVAFAGRTVFPTRFLVRHYPIRSGEHGHRKIGAERQARYDPSELAKGWHVHYDKLPHEFRFVWDPAQLQLFDSARVRRELLERSRDADAADAGNRTHAELQRLRDQVRRLSDENAQLTLTTVEQADMIRRADVEISDQGEHRRRLIRDNRHLSRELDAIRSSRSWTVTAPLRAAYALLAAPAPSAEPTPATEAGEDATFAAAAHHVAPRWGDLDRRTPVSWSWGLDRGLPVDRHYIVTFLERHRQDIRGRVLEVKDPGYATRFGSDVEAIDVLDIDRTNRMATIVADLAKAEGLPVATYDCVILTQTLHIVYDVRAALRHAIGMLRPGGVLLCTLPAVSRVNDENGGVDSGDFWRFTRAAVDGLFAEQANGTDRTIWTVGNVKTCAAFLYGFAAEELAPADLDFHDPWFPLLHCVRAVRR